MRKVALRSPLDRAPPAESSRRLPRTPQHLAPRVFGRCALITSLYSLSALLGGSATAGQVHDHPGAFNTPEIAPLRTTRHAEQRLENTIHSPSYFETDGRPYIRNDLGTNKLNKLSDKSAQLIKGHALSQISKERFSQTPNYRAIGTIADGRVDMSYSAYVIPDITMEPTSLVSMASFRSTKLIRKSPLRTITRHEQPELAATDQNDNRHILDAWNKTKLAAQIHYRQIGIVVLIAAAVIILILLWNNSIRRQRERLRISEERYQSAMEAVSEAVWEWDMETDRRHFSQGFFNRLGYTETQIPTDNHQWLNLIHPDDRDRFQTEVLRHSGAADQGASPLILKYRVRTPSGTYVIVESRGRVVAWNDAKQPYLQRGTLRDITKQQQALGALKRSQQNLQRLNKRFALAADVISLGVWERVLGDSDHFIFDKRMFEIYGLHPKPLVAFSDWIKHVHPDDRQLILDSTRQMVEEGDGTQLEFRIHRTDGSLRYIYAGITVIPGEDGKPAHLIGVNWDITERKLSEEQFKKVLNALPVAVVITDDDGKIVFTNEQAQREIGGKQPLTGRHTTEFYANDKQHEKILAELQQTGQIVGEEVHFRRQSGEVIQCLLSAIPIHFDGQDVLLGVVINITERLQTEKQLAMAKEQAEEASRFKSRFLANMSHEIRTPMNAIVGFGHLLNRTALTPQQLDYLGNIQVSAHSLLNLIDDILDFSKIEAGQLRIENIDFDLNQVLDNIATLAGTRLAERPVEFIYDIDPKVPMQLRGDPHRLTQILTNLVGNAIKFTEHGGIVVRIRQQEDSEPPRLVFTVEDSGIGIPDEKIDTLFAPFIQADGSTTREYGGTGLGLSICRQLTELMGGTISAHSRPGDGSRFEFCLPFHIAAPIDSRVPMPDTKGMRIMLVDDNAIARQVLSDLLLSLSFRVDVAVSGDAALDILHTKEKSYDVLLMDWKMPGRDGFETARQVRTLALDTQPTIVIMTAYGREAIEQQLDISSINGFLVKPITPSQLLDTIAQAVNPGHYDSGQPRANAATYNVRHQLKGRVLLVEDNFINQQVARELLEQMGIEVKVCENGVQAISAVQTSQPDLILMDIQMPDIDGYETTRRIRRIPNTATLPIIAMTANAMAGDAERSIEAGMNGHIPKPVDPILLHATIGTWLEHVESDPTHGTTAAGPAQTASPASIQPKLERPHNNASTPAAIDYELGVQRVSGNRVLYAKLLQDFSTRYQDVAEQLEQLCKPPVDKDAERMFHTLKGVAGNIGAEAVQNIAAELEQQVRAGQMDAVSSNLPRLKHLLNLALKAADHFKQKDDMHKVDTTPQGMTDPQATIRELAVMLDKSEAEALNKVSNLSIQGAGDEAQLLLNQLQKQIHDYDFTTARKTLNLLATELGIHDLILSKT